MTALVPIQNLRSGVDSKRPDATGLAFGQVAINYHESDPAIYLRGHDNALIKVGPVFVGATAPNSTPAGASGVAVGEKWLDISDDNAVLRIWDGGDWVVPQPAPSGTVVTDASVGVVTSNMIADGTIVDADISGTAAIADGKLATISTGGKVANSATTATSANTVNAIVSRDSSGNFSAGVITADLAGTASAIADDSVTNAKVSPAAAIDPAKIDGTAVVDNDSRLTDERTPLDGSVTNAKVAANAAIADTKLATISTGGKVSNSATTATSANTNGAIVARDGSGNFSAGTITANLSGNASTATSLQTARTIGGVSFNGTANINLPGVNTVGNQNTTGSAASLTTARQINGTNFNGTANITTANWGTARNISIGGTSKSVNGSANVTWATSEIAAQTAVTLATARNINGVSFNGGANITVNPFSTTGAAFSNGFGGRYVSTGNPTGGSNGDLWYKV